MILDWRTNPYEAGPADALGYHVEPIRALAVICGEQRLANVTLTDSRLLLVCSIAEAYRDCRAEPTVDRIVRMLAIRGYDTRGALQWLLKLFEASGSGDSRHADAVRQRAVRVARGHA